jgi:hypothetical protein
MHAYEKSSRNEGGAARSIPVAEMQHLTQNLKMTGTINQIDWAEQIRVQVNAEFDRVAKALESAASMRADPDQADVQAMIAILEDKRAEVMANDRAGYFIHDWQELRGQVREMITEDPRYGTIKASRAARKQWTPPSSAPRQANGFAPGNTKCETKASR